MKLFAVHSDGKLTDGYCTYCFETKKDAEMEFIVDCYDIPENLGVELVEYAPVNATEKLVEAVKECKNALENVGLIEPDFDQVEAAQENARDALDAYESTK